MASLKASNRAPEKPFVALVLQGGGALGAYHVGAYEALQEAGYAPDWVAGISIGAFNSAVIAGNPLERRLDRLTELWDLISRPDDWTTWLHQFRPDWSNTFSYWEAIAFGQPHFFTPRHINPYFAPPGTSEATSWYDTSPMRATLERVTDFTLINTAATRISLGATDVETGDIVYFDNKDRVTEITPDHVMASGSLPPGFPAVKVGDRLYWDGGCVSNTPLNAILQDQPKGHSIVFMIDLWNQVGQAPQTIDEVALRQKQIQYSSRTEHDIETVAAKVDLRHSLAALNRADAGGGKAASGADVTTASADRMDIVHIIYQPESAEEMSGSDAEFSRLSIRARREAGYRDLTKALEDAPWHKTAKPPQLGAVVHCMKGDTITSRVGSAVAHRRLSGRVPVGAAAE